MKYEADFLVTGGGVFADVPDDRRRTEAQSAPEDPAQLRRRLIAERALAVVTARTCPEDECDCAGDGPDSSRDAKKPARRQGERRLPTFGIGDEVVWTSQAGGQQVQKRGTIVEVVPVGGQPTRRLRRGVGAPRNHESYVVHARQQNGRIDTYWPRVSALSRA